MLASKSGSHVEDYFARSMNRNLDHYTYANQGNVGYFCRESLMKNCESILIV